MLEMSVTTLLATLTSSLNSATSSFPTTSDAILPPQDGISLFDTKNELLLSYLQNLVFLILLKLREASSTSATTNDNGRKTGLEGDGEAGGSLDIWNEVVKKLINTRVYLEKGVRPLEGRLRYQIEKVVSAAEEAERLQTGQGKRVSKEDGKNGTKARDGNSDATGSGSEGSEDNSENSSGEEEEEEEAQPKIKSKIDDLSYRPNPSALLLRKPDPSSSTSKARPSTSSVGGTYKPPRITPTSMPSTDTKTSTSRTGMRKSHLLDEFVSTELSSAPTAEPSIGSNRTILARGRGALSTREREKERERTEYEERNFSRLPKEGKAERRKKGGRRNDDRFGGEDWAGLGEVGDRVSRSVSSAGRKGGVLERREKRRRGVGDVSGGGLGMGEAFEKRRKILEGRAERKRKGR